MPKLHELLAIEGSLKTQAEKTRAELMSTFEKKTHHFTEKTKSFRPFGEGQPTVVESQLDLQTTVPQELKWVSEFIVKALNASRQIAEANTAARADVILEDGTPLLRNAPVTLLMELDKRAHEMHDLVAAIPTLDPAKGFRPDTDRGRGVFKARDVMDQRTKKVQKPLTMAPATDKHPAQVQLITEDIPVGDLTTLEWSGLITPAAKSEMLGRVESLTRAIKKAKSRANDTEVPSKIEEIGSVITNYVFAL